MNEDASRPQDEDISSFDLVNEKEDRRSHIADLVQTIKETADKLAVDGTTRGDLKILSRTLRELRYAFKVFSPYRRKRKVTVFGSARTQPDEPAYSQAVDLGRAMAEAGWLVVTGAASGIMEAGHRGAGRESSMGLNIMLPFEQSANPVIAGDPKLVHMKYFFTRKLMFVKECDAVVCSPGGFGTLDEAMEVITLLQTGKRDMMPVVLLDPPGGQYWQALLDFVNNHLLQGADDLARGLAPYKLTDSYEVAARRDSAVLPRLSQHAVREARSGVAAEEPLHPAAARRHQSPNSRDILTDGNFQQREPLPLERRRAGPGPPAAAGLPLQPPQPGPAAAIDRRDQPRQRGMTEGWVMSRVQDMRWQPDISENLVPRCDAMTAMEQHLVHRPDLLITSALVPRFFLCIFVVGAADPDANAGIKGNENSPGGTNEPDH